MPNIAANLAIDALYGLGAVSGVAWRSGGYYVDQALSNSLTRYGIPAAGLGFAAMDWASDGDMSLLGMGGLAAAGIMGARGAYTGAFGSLGGRLGAYRGTISDFMTGGSPLAYGMRQGLGGSAAFKRFATSIPKIKISTR